MTKKKAWYTVGLDAGDYHIKWNPKHRKYELTANDPKARIQKAYADQSAFIVEGHEPEIMEE